MEDKKTFFDLQTLFVNRIDSHFSGSKLITFTLLLPVVDVLIGDLFFDTEDEGGITKARALDLFKPVITNDMDLPSSYAVKVTNPLQFHLSIKYLSHGLSFRQVAAVINSTKDITGLTKLGCMTDTKISGYARVLTAVNLQKIGSLMAIDSVWAFSLAFDVSTHLGRSYFDTRIRIHVNGELYNLHVLAILIFGRHTAQAQFNLLVKMLDALYTPWRTKLIGIGSDGAAVMTGRIGGIVTLVEQVVVYYVYRTWCGLY